MFQENASQAASPICPYCEYHLDAGPLPTRCPRCNVQFKSDGPPEDTQEQIQNQEQAQSAAPQKANLSDEPAPETARPLQAAATEDVVVSVQSPLVSSAAAVNPAATDNSAAATEAISVEPATSHAWPK